MTQIIPIPQHTDPSQLLQYSHHRTQEAHIFSYKPYLSHITFARVSLIPYSEFLSVSHRYSSKLERNILEHPPPPPTPQFSFQKRHQRTVSSRCKLAAFYSNYRPRVHPSQFCGHRRLGAMNR